MSWYLVAFVVTSAISAVTSQIQGAEGGHGAAVIDKIAGGGEVRSADILNVIGAGAGAGAGAGEVRSADILNVIGAGGGGSTNTGMTSPGEASSGNINNVISGAGPMKRFTLREVNTMIDGMNNGYRFRFDGTRSTNVGEATISKNQLLTMREQLLQLTASAAATKQFTANEIRMMLAGMKNGMHYNRQGQVSSQESGELLYTLTDLQNLLAQIEAQEQVLQRFSLSEIRRLIRGMENGLQYNYQGQIATEGQKTLDLHQLRSYLSRLESNAGSSGPTDIPSMPNIGTGNKDLGTQQTAVFTRADLDRMKIGIANGLKYNYQGQMALPGQAVLSIGRINELYAKLDSKGAMGGGGPRATFTLQDVESMIRGMDRGLVYNYQGSEALPGEQTLSRPDLIALLNQLSPQTGTGGTLQTAQFTLIDVDRMITGMDNGLSYNYNGLEASPGEKTLTRGDLNRFRDDLRAKGMLQTADFTRTDLDRMKNGIANGLKYNYQGQMALPGQAVLSIERINELYAKLDAKGPMGGGGQSTSFKLQDVESMIRGMNRGLVYNYQGSEALPGEQTLSRKDLERLLNQLSSQPGSFIESVAFK